MAFTHTPQKKRKKPDKNRLFEAPRLFSLNSYQFYLLTNYGGQFPWFDIKVNVGCSSDVATVKITLQVKEAVVHNFSQLRSFWS